MKTVSSCQQGRAARNHEGRPVQWTRRPAQVKAETERCSPAARPVYMVRDGISWSEM
jgi:hypothetical protein